MVVRAARTLGRLLRPPRRLRFTRAGSLLTAMVIGLGFATLNTGNNLLYLVLGGLLGLIVLSGWLSEQALRAISVDRRLPRAVTAREPARIVYEITNRKRRFPSLALEITEPGFPQTAFMTAAWPGQRAAARADAVFPARGVYRLHRLTVRTTFPFGLFVKERDFDAAGTLIVWPRTDRLVRAPLRAGERAYRFSSAAPRTSGGRGEYRSLRPYQPGDDPRDVHWRTSARLREPVIREYERDASETLWLCLDLRGVPGEAAEILVEIAAALAARASAQGDRFGLATNDLVIEPGSGPGQLEAVLDALARAQFRADAPLLAAPADRAQCVLIAVSRDDADYGDHFTAADG